MNCLSHEHLNEYIPSCLAFFKRIMRKPAVMISVLIILCGPSFLAAKSNPSANSNIHLSDTSLPAVGRQETLLTIAHFGRYAITVESPQGTAVQLIDKMAGPTQKYGTIGEADGRMDLFLDRGTYRIVTYSHESGGGMVTLAVSEFVEMNAKQRPILEELKIVTTSVADSQLRSYWMDIKQRRYVAIEAAGRNLSDLRIWKNGTWLVDAQPDIRTTEPVPGKPLTALTIAAELQPGVYLVSAYGGKGLSWAHTSAETPLYIRFGIPKRFVAGRSYHVAGPFGADRFLIPKKANFFRLELPGAEDAGMRVSDFDERKPFSRSGNIQRITKKSIPPVAEIRTSSHATGYYLVTVTREAGKSYVLQHFTLSDRYTFNGIGDYWLSTIHSGHGADSVDATAIITERPRSKRKQKMFQKSVITISRGMGWQRRFNFAEPFTLYVEIEDTGRYTIDGRGAKGEFRVEPFLIYRPRNYKTPPFRTSGHTWDLNAGHYVLSARPLHGAKGILNLRIRPQKTGITEERSVQSAAIFPQITLKRRTDYTVYLNRQPGVSAGIILRKLPVDLRTALPVTQRSGDTLTVPVKIPETGRLTAVAEDGSLLNLSVEKVSSQAYHSKKVSAYLRQEGRQGTLSINKKHKKEHVVSPGTYIVTIAQTGKNTQTYALTLTPARYDPGAVLQSLPQDVVTNLPRFPVLASGTAQFFDIDRGENKTFLLNVTHPALYRIESTGLLATQGNIRTRINPALDRQNRNGIGRNFLIQQYLREGDYQLTVSPIAESRGHMGIHLSPTPLKNGGLLGTDVPARESLRAGEGIMYRFDIQKTGRYRLNAIGLNREFKMRLEDSEGWPIVAPGLIAEIDHRFQAGSYRIIILPQAVDCRVVTCLERVAADQPFSGHGPHLIPFPLYGKNIHHIWREPAAGEERRPDRWCFSVPAAVDAVIRLSDEMAGMLYLMGKELPDKVFAHKSSTIVLPPRKTWNGTLEQGDYCIDVKSRRKNNRLGYTLNIAFEQLTAGLSRGISAPASIPVSVGRDQRIELYSIGNADVNAKLFNEDGQKIAQNDDRNDDWNFLISKNVKAGIYQLKVASAAGGSASTTIVMRTPDEVAEGALTPPIDTTISISGLRSYPLHIAPRKDVVVISAAADENIGVSLERKGDEGWKTIGDATGKRPFLAASLSRSRGSSLSSYRLQVQSIDRRKATVRLRMVTLAPKAEAGSGLSGRGIKLEPVKGIEPPMGIAYITFKHPGVFQVDEDFDTISYAAKRGDRFTSAKQGRLLAGEKEIWIMAGKKKRGHDRIRGTRFRLSDTPLSVTLPQRDTAFVDLTPHINGPVLLHIESRLDQPGICLTPSGASPAKTITGIGVSRQSAVAVGRADGVSIAAIWHAGESAYPLPVKVRQYCFPKPVDRKAVYGITDITLEGRYAGRFVLPAGMKRLRLVLPPAAAAAFMQNGKIAELHWSGAQAITRFSDTNADSVMVLYAGGTQSQAGMNIIPIHSDDAFPVLNDRVILKRHAATSGSIQLNVALPPRNASAGVRLKLYGNDIQATVIDRHGKILHGKNPKVTDGSTVIVSYAPGFVMVWLEGGAINPWHAINTETNSPIDGSRQVALHGRAMTFSLTPMEDTVLQMKTDVPIITYLHGGKLPPQVKISPNGADMAIYLPQSSSSDAINAGGEGTENSPRMISVTATDNGALTGKAEFMVNTAVMLSEGIGPRVMLGPGDSRLFAFMVKHDGAVGIGVRASADRAMCSLMDHTGNVIGNGVVQMHDLIPGKYLLAVTIPEDSQALEIQPVVVNIEPPGAEPPLDVIRNYMKMAGTAGEE